MEHEDSELYLKAQDIWVQVTIDPVLDDNDELLRAVHIVSDITTHKKLEALLHQAQKKESKG